MDATGGSSDGDFAIVVGIDRYRGFDPLDSAVADAEEFHRWLLKRAHVPDTQAVLIRGPRRRGAYKPVLQRINDAFLEILTSDHPAPRRLYFYFAGHGCSVGHDHVNLLMADATMQSGSSGMDTTAYHSVLGQTAPFPEQVFFYDCCRTRDMYARGLGPPFTLDELDRPVAQAVYYATLSGEPTVESIPDVVTDGRGVFTEALLDGLNGGAADPGSDSPVVTVESLAGFVARRMQQLLLTKGIWQEPDFYRRGPTDDIALVTPPRVKEIAITLTAGPEDDRFVVKNANLREVAGGPVRKRIGYCQLPVGLYMAEASPSGRRKLFHVEPATPDVVELVREDG